MKNSRKEMAGAVWFFAPSRNSKISKLQNRNLGISASTHDAIGLGGSSAPPCLLSLSDLHGTLVKEPTMDSLASLISKKKEEKESLKASSTATAVGAGGKRYMRQADVERARKRQYREQERQEAQEREEKRRQREREAREKERRRQQVLAERRAAVKEGLAAKGAAGGAGWVGLSRKRAAPGSSPGAGDAGSGGAGGGEDGEVMLPKAEVVVRLRNMGEPTTLFGETDVERLARLRTLELSASTFMADTALEGSYVVRNTFLEKDGANDEDNDDDDDDDDDDDSDDDDDDGAGGTGGGGGGSSSSSSSSSGGASGSGGAAAAKTEKKKREKSRPGVEADISTESTKQRGKYVKRFFRALLKEWAMELRGRDEAVKRLAAGKVATKTHKQCKDYIRPFFKQLKSQQVPPDILLATRRIVCFCEQREYVKANDLYVQMAIGNAPWPIGVTMVGIHERGGRDRIKSNKVAHVMNDEMMRKYITSIKRLMKFTQTKRPTDPSKMVL